MLIHDSSSKKLTMILYHLCFKYSVTLNCGLCVFDLHISTNFTFTVLYLALSLFYYSKYLLLSILKFKEYFILYSFFNIQTKKQFQKQEIK